MQQHDEVVVDAGTDRAGAKRDDTAAPSRSIMRRASMFGTQSKGMMERTSLKSKSQDAETKPPSVRRSISGGGMGGLFAEMKLKAQKAKDNS